MAEKDSFQASNKLWPRSTSLFLFLVGLALSITSFSVVLNMPELEWHPTQDAELRTTYDTYRETGTLLIKPTGTGSTHTQASGSDPLSPAAWDDDPGSYLVASLLSHITQSESPYPGLGLVQALLIAVPLLWLPTAVARIFKRARAGYALVLLPPVMWLVNNGTILVGTEYGLSDEVSTLRVYALYGIPASLAFLSLSLVLLFSTFRLKLRALVAASLLIALLAGFGNVFRSWSGVGVAAAVGVLWWLNSSGRWRWARAVIASIVAIALAFVIQAGIMNAINTGRAEATGQTSEELSNAPRTWGPLYVGLSYPEPITGEPSRFGIPWSDEFDSDEVREVDPDVVIGGEQDDLILKDLYLEEVFADPMGVLNLYLLKALFVIKQFGAMIIFILVGFVLALMRRAPQRRPLGAALAISLPTLALGFLPPVLVMPLLYYYSELSAALGLLMAVSLGALIWSFTSMPSHVRASERSRLSGRIPVGAHSPDQPTHVSVVVPTRNGERVIEATVRTLAEVLTSGDEVIVVENGSTDGTSAVLGRLSAGWSYPCKLVVRHSKPGLGEALRTGVLASHGQRLLLTADDLPFGLSDFRQFKHLPDDVVVAVGSKAHPDSEVTRSLRRTVQSRIFRFLRESLLQSRVGDSQGTLWVDGDWGRAFALLSREIGLMWTTELVLAAEQQGISVREVPVSLHDLHESGSSRFRFSDAWQSVVGFTRLAVYKDDYCNEDWVRSTTPAVLDEVTAVLDEAAVADKPAARPAEPAVVDELAMADEPTMVGEPAGAEEPALKL